MFAGVTTHCSNSRFKVQFRVEAQSKYNLQLSLKQVEMQLNEAPICSINTMPTFLLCHGMVCPQFTHRRMCLNCDMAHPYSVHNPLPSLEGPGINIQQKQQQPIRQENPALSEKGETELLHQMHDLTLAV